MKPSPNSWITGLNLNPSPRLRLFCFPYAGGGASMFHSWPRLLAGAGIEVRAIQLPGRETRLKEAPFESLPRLVDSLMDALPFYIDRPFSFFGHSMGALIAFEVARALRRKQLPQPEHLFASGSKPPHLLNREPPLHPLPDADFIGALGERYDSVTELLDQPELLELALPKLRADFKMIETYQHLAGEPLACPLSVFGGVEDPLVPWAALQEWREQTIGPFRIYQFRGGHFFLDDSRNEVAQTIIQASNCAGALSTCASPS